MTRVGSCVGANHEWLVAKGKKPLVGKLCFCKRFIYTNSGPQKVAIDPGCCRDCGRPIDDHPFKDCG